MHFLENNRELTVRYLKRQNYIHFITFIMATIPPGVNPFQIKIRYHEDRIRLCISVRFWSLQMSQCYTYLHSHPSIPLKMKALFLVPVAVQVCVLSKATDANAKDFSTHTHFRIWGVVGLLTSQIHRR